MRRRTEKGRVNRAKARGTIPAGSPSVGTYCLFPHLDGFKHILSAKCKHIPWKACRAQRPWLTKPSPAGLQPRRTSSILPLSCGGKGFPLLSFTMQEGDGVYAGLTFLARWPVPLAQEVPHFSQPSNQTHLNRGCSSQHSTRHGPSGSVLLRLEHHQL